ncbi:malate dehydrogenase MDH1 [Colletotrichum sp. SAR11_240]|nr:malate dehydrogenase MDH1 [Colletotrichum sp. SAR11_240]
MDLVKVKREYNMIPKEYHDWLMSRQAASLAHGVFREAEKSCKEAEGAMSAAEEDVAEADRRLRGATLQVFEALGAAPTDGDQGQGQGQGRLSTRSLTDAQKKMLENANEAAHRAAAGDIAGMISMTVNSASKRPHTSAAAQCKEPQPQ